MAGVTNGALLLRDVWGEKAATSTFAKALGLKSEQNVSKGTLLSSFIPNKKQVPRQDGNPTHNYQVYKNDVISMFCSEQDVAPLSNYEFQLLNGIKSPGARFEVFVNGVLEWGSKLKKDDIVSLCVPHLTFRNLSVCSAAVRWIGILPSEDGIKFGVEILEERYRGSGCTNGYFREIQYFLCKENRGMFESLDKLAPNADHPLIATGEIAAKRSPPAPTNIPGTQSTSLGPHLNTRFQTQKDPVSIVLPPPQFKKGERVVTYNKDQIPIYGIVRWTGLVNHGEVKVNAIGIETDLSVSSKAFLVTFTEIDHHFNCENPRHGKVFIPESMVLSEAEVATANNSKENIQQNTSSKAHATPPQDSVSSDFSMNSAVQLSDPLRYGVIRWMGNLPNVSNHIAGLELESVMDGCGDGTRNGVRYFSCEYGRGFFCPVSSLKRDQRQVSSSASDDPETQSLNELSQIHAAGGRGLNIDSECATLKEEKLMLEHELRAVKDELAACKLELSAKSSELEVSTANLAVNEVELAESKANLVACQTELESHKVSQNNESFKQELEATKKELAAHNIDVWKVSRDRVRMEKEIGNGGWGAVFEGRIQVAIKRLHPAILTPHNLTRLQREMRLLAEIRHPNLVQFVGAVLDEQVGTEPPLIITELLDMNLREAYEQNQLQPGNRLSIFIDVARALDYLHQRYEPIIHRDVSAPNVLLQRLPNNRWKGKVSDLGSANFLQNAQTMAEGAIVYSPPEVIPQPYALDLDSEPPQQTVKIDVYSYGIVLCEVSASRFPSQENYREMFRQVQREQPQMYALIVRCTKKDPNDRPTMAEVLVELENIPQSR